MHDISKGMVLTLFVVDAQVVLPAKTVKQTWTNALQTPVCMEGHVWTEEMVMNVAVWQVLRVHFASKTAMNVPGWSNDVYI